MAVLDFGKNRFAVTVSGTTVQNHAPATPGAPIGSNGSLFTSPARPIINSVSPNSGVTSGGTAVTITGLLLTGTTDVKFDGTSATSIVVVNATTITCNTPSHALGAVSVQILNPGGNDTLNNAFTYVPLTQSIILDYAIANVISSNLTIDYAIQLQKSFVLDYAIGITNYPYYDFHTAKPSTNVENTFDYTWTPTVIDPVLFAIAQPASPPDHVVGPNRTAYFVNNFYGDFYLRIWLDPALRSLSNPRIGVPIPFNVWNAFPDSNNLVELLYTDLDGVVPDFTLPLAFGEYEYKVVNFSITSDAPAEINGYIDFIFDQGSAQLHLIATIIGILKALPNEPITETWRWNTALNIAKGSKEQRAGLRYRPRYNVSYPTFLNDNAGYRSHYTQLWTFLSRSLRVPLFQYAADVTPAMAGATKLFFDPTITDMRSGEYIAIVDGATDEFVLVKPLTIDVDGATLENPLEADIAVTCKVMPTLEMRLAPASGLSMDALNGNATINADSVQGRDLIRPAGAAPTITTFDGLTVIPERFVVQSSNSDNFDQATETIDNDTSLPVPYTFWPMPFASGPRQWKIDRETDLKYWQTLGDTFAGSRKPFLLPTWREDLTLYEAAIIGASTMRVNESDFPNMVSNESYSRLMFVTASGVEYHTVTTAVDSGLGYVDVVLGESITDANIQFISFLNLCRIQDDIIQLSHYVGYTLVKLNFRTINE